VTKRRYEGEEVHFMGFKTHLSDDCIAGSCRGAFLPRNSTLLDEGGRTLIFVEYLQEPLLVLHVMLVSP
jgi:hypothetical protein